MGDKKGVLAIVSGFSGAGKGTIMKSLMERYGEEYGLSISATTRAPRPGEENGREYFFVTEEEFLQMIKDDNLIEYANYVGNYYGTPKQYVMEQLAKGKNVILEIEMQGALKVKAKMPDTALLFVTTKDAKTLKERLTGRGTETEDVIAQRMRRAIEESSGITDYDYLVINDKLDDAVNLVHQLITGIRDQKEETFDAYRISSNIDFINEMKHDLEQIMEGE